MKSSIHPQYHQTKVTCACGNSFIVGSTVPEIRVEICNQCHPFFTGKQKFIDTAGRIDRFRARIKQAELRKLNKPSTAPVSTADVTETKSDAADNETVKAD